MADGKFLALSDINAYKASVNLSNYIWNIVLNWNFFAKDTVGKQYVRAVDSISATIAEGFGRYTKKDKINFYRYSFGSLQESLDWTEKAKNRRLLTEEQYNTISKVLGQLPIEIHYLIKYTNQKLKI